MTEEQEYVLLDSIISLIFLSSILLSILYFYQ